MLCAEQNKVWEVQTSIEEMAETRLWGQVKLLVIIQGFCCTSFKLYQLEASMLITNLNMSESGCYVGSLRVSWGYNLGL